jgi:hypothetical protein
MVTQDRYRAMLFGFLMHLVNGWLFAIVYALSFETVGCATWWLGALAGVVYGFFVLVALMPLRPAAAPTHGQRALWTDADAHAPAAGFLTLHYRRRTPIVTLLAHAAYRTVLAGFYRLAAP